jgi:surface antigen
VTALQRRARYKGRPCQWHPARRRRPAAFFSLSLALGLGGCSLSYQLDNLFEKKDEGQVERAAIMRSVLPKGNSEMPAEADLAIARAAVSEVLARGGKDSSMPWENPQTGARGTVTPVAPTYTVNGVTCRDFLASYVKSGTEAWMQGEACRAERGKWEVRSLRPWKKT